jgi:protein-tyrosine phosphatase
MPMKRLLCVCLGNICRSPAGEGVLRARAVAAGLEDRVEVDSAGTIDFHRGKPADARMQRAAEARGYTLTSRARQVRPEDFRRYDLIIAMDRSNYDDLRALRPADARADLRMLGSFLPGATGPTGRDVPDPYHGGDAGFEEVLDLLESAAGPILDTLTAEEAGRG